MAETVETGEVNLLQTVAGDTNNHHLNGYTIEVIY